MAPRTIPESKAVAGWHWLNAEGTVARYEDSPLSGRKVRAGQVLRHRGGVEVCRRGLHASRRALDALHYAPGPVVCRVASWGEVSREDDKLASGFRRCVWKRDATRVLWGYAADVAAAWLRHAESNGCVVGRDGAEATDRLIGLWRAAADGRRPRDRDLLRANEAVAMAFRDGDKVALYPLYLSNDEKHLSPWGTAAAVGRDFEKGDSFYFNGKKKTTPERMLAARLRALGPR